MPSCVAETIFRDFFLFLYSLLMRGLKFALLLSAAVSMFTACREDYVVIPPEDTPVDEGNPEAPIKGFYLLNEGNMGTNKASLDFYDYTTGIYSQNIFPSRNPNVTKELGDVGNDLQIYGKRMYAVINCSNLVEVMTADSALHIGMISVPNCRNIVFHDDKAYVSSYAGPVQIGNMQLGYVAEIDTATLQITRKCTVGYNPEEMVVLDGVASPDGKPKLYVANSGGYTPPDYDNTVSVIDLESFTEEKKIEIGINLHRMRADKYGDIYITSRGDYYDVPSNLYCFDPKSETVKKTFDMAATNMCIVGDSLYVVAWTTDNYSGEQQVSYALVDVKDERLLSNSLITDGTTINIPYCIGVNPDTKEFVITDAGDYVSPGMLYYFNPGGTLKWKQITGDVPGHLAFLR